MINELSHWPILEDLRQNCATVAIESNKPVHVNQLPLEILHTIFEFCGGIPERKANITRRRHPALAIPCVCSYWRTIALNYPPMWSHADVTFFSKEMADLVRRRLGKGLWESLECNLKFAPSTTVNWMLPQICHSKGVSLDIPTVRDVIGMLEKRNLLTPRTPNYPRRKYTPLVQRCA